MGTSLVVQPFASLVDLVPEDCPRLLINLEHVGDFGSRSNDVVYLGKCDDGVRELCRLLGWEKELEDEWEKTKDTLERVGEGEPASEKDKKKAGKEVRAARFREEGERSRLRWPYPITVIQSNTLLLQRILRSQLMRRRSMVVKIRRGLMASFDRSRSVHRVLSHLVVLAYPLVTSSFYLYN